MSEHYFTAQPSSEAREHEVRYRARGVDYAVSAPDGVFSAQQLDRGTAVLLDKAPRTALPELTGDASAQPLCVDVGCGWGPITFALAHEHPHATVLGVDVNERALEAARRNTVRLGLTQHVVISDARTAVEQLRTDGKHADLIWSNPPIRIGKASLHKLLTTWLELLRPGTGEAYWVVQKNLGADSLVDWLNTQGFPSEKLGSSKGFRIIKSTR